MREIARATNLASVSLHKVLFIWRYLIMNARSLYALSSIAAVFAFLWFKRSAWGRPHWDAFKLRVPLKIGDGNDAVHNLYWGCDEALPPVFHASPDWKFLGREPVALGSLKLQQLSHRAANARPRRVMTREQPAFEPNRH